MRRALTIAGSDSSGGAGIQADLKTFAAHGVYGLSAITAVTAQNTLGVTAIETLPADLVTAQIEAVVSDLGADAAKTGMLANAAIVEAVAAAVQDLEIPLLVVDPVMIAKSGDRLLDDEAVGAMKSELLRRAFLVTPNIPEAETLAGMTRVPGTSTHGTGCTFAAAVAARLALGHPLEEAIPQAQAYVGDAIRHAPGLGRGHGHAPGLGRGHGPMDHFRGRYT
jgi:hydroxymethylpyrimidine/phosphomethylpyrimidine kinase